MKIKYMGKLDPETNPLPTNKLKEGAIRFNEPTDRKKQNIQTSIVTFIIILFYSNNKSNNFTGLKLNGSIIKIY